MKINVKKRKTMAIANTNKEIKLQIDNIPVEQVKFFNYLGQVITEDARCEKEIRKRIAMAKQKFKDMYTKKTLKLDLRKRILKAYVWTVALYGAETWIIIKTTKQKLEAFEMWCWRRLEVISWMERKTNIEVLQQVGESREIMKIITIRRLRWMGHVMRHPGLMHDMIEGKIPGKRGRGRPRCTLIAHLLNDTGSFNFAELKKTAEERLRWKLIIKGVTS